MFVQICMSSVDLVLHTLMAIREQECRWPTWFLVSWCAGVTARPARSKKKPVPMNMSALYINSLLLPQGTSLQNGEPEKWMFQCI